MIKASEKTSQRGTSAAERLLYIFREDAGHPRYGNPGGGRQRIRPVAPVRRDEPPAAPPSQPESHYRDLLARQVGGETEVQLPFGRCDVLTDTAIFEVEPVARWKAGFAQALLYSVQVPQRGALALYGAGLPIKGLRTKLAALPPPGIEIWWLEGGQFACVEELSSR